MPVRVTQAKNIEFAFEVVATLKESGIRPTLVISGPPDPHEAGKMGYYRGLLELRTRMELEEEVSFVYQSGPDPAAPNFLEYNQLGELYRVSDLLFMPSHREGFGMPVLEAGLAGLPVISAEIPAAVEIGGQEVITFPVESTPVQVAQRILDWTRRSSQYRLRKRIRQEYTWKAIVHRDILPLLKQSEAA
jgi:glycosyltransferase involved in cell wall biosynthesis